ncbi:hypothetical protein AVEN_79932-1 [Araneus ventricosus]|uniref:Uncharacterized protein n=1 Tax=Araneus ventricosus TaxID=182803 RepID=A0A4Y2UDG9_ARAVE|nr:hypothetical protein AVEN_79932-1 [Araneus ventricosus]
MDQKTNVDKGITKEDCITEEFLDSVENWWSNDQENRKTADSQQRNTENEDLGSGQMNIGRNYDLSNAPTVTKEAFLDAVENWWLNDQENRNQQVLSKETLKMKISTMVI